MPTLPCTVRNIGGECSGRIGISVTAAPPAVLVCCNGRFVGADHGRAMLRIRLVRFTRRSRPAIPRPGRRAPCHGSRGSVALLTSPFAGCTRSCTPRAPSPAPAPTPSAARARHAHRLSSERSAALRRNLFSSRWPRRPCLLLTASSSSMGRHAPHAGPASVFVVYGEARTPAGPTPFPPLQPAIPLLLSAHRSLRGEAVHDGRGGTSLVGSAPLHQTDIGQN